MPQKVFIYALLATVVIAVSLEKGTVIGRAEFSEDENRYLVRYKNAQGIAMELWWNESALSAGESDDKGSDTQESDTPSDPSNPSGDSVPPVNPSDGSSAGDNPGIEV